MKKDSTAWVWIAAAGLFVLLLLIGGAMYAIPQYRVWQKELAGKALLREAEWSRQIKVEEAKAALESAEMLKEAEIIRAQGMADSIGIVGGELENNPTYVRYLWVQGLHDGSSEIIYVPTEANIPIMEATRLK